MDKVKMIYEFCKNHEKLNSDIADQMTSEKMKMSYESASTSFYAVKTFIEVNFNDLIK